MNRTLDRQGRDFLHTPGPTHIPDRVLNAMHRQPYDLVDPRLLDLTASCFEELKPVFRTESEVFIYASNGHGGWEAAISNLFDPGDAVLLPEMGMFGARWGNVAKELGLEPSYVTSDYRRAVEPAALEEALRADKGHRIKGVLAVHTDTSSGITCDLAAYRRAIDAAGHPALLVADVIASLAAAPFEMDAWGVDAAICGSQKGLMCPPGLAYVAAGPRALARAEQVTRTRFYWDWRERSNKELYRRFCGTAPEQALFALRAALDIVAEQGLDAIIARHARLAGAVQRAVEAWATGGALALNAVVPSERSVSLTAIRVADGIDAEVLRTYAREQFSVAVAGSYGTLTGKVFRIGHLGDLNEPMMLGCLGAVEATLIALGVPHGDGALRAAAAFLAGAPPGAGMGEQAAMPARDLAAVAAGAAAGAAAGE